MSRVIVSGSRTIKDREFVSRILQKHLHTGDTVLVGMCEEGVDLLAVQFVKRYPERLTLEPHYADWDRHGKVAGPIRNREMATADADKLIAIWDGLSSGTRDMIHQALVHGLEVHVYQYRSTHGRTYPR